MCRQPGSYRTPLFQPYINEGSLSDTGYVFFILSLVGAVLFALFYGLAILNGGHPLFTADS